jgi:hypothetical protein
MCALQEEWMRSIPLKLRAELAADPFMKKCCLCGKRPQWHHAIIISGRQLNEKWAIVPACEEHHRDSLEKLELIALNRATHEELQAISKAIDFFQRRSYLREKYKGKM